LLFRQWRQSKPIFYLDTISPLQAQNPLHFSFTHQSVHTFNVLYLRKTCIISMLTTK
jgi:hypothetical protein